MQRTPAGAGFSMPRRWAWLWCGAHLTVGALGPVALLLAQDPLRGDAATPLNAERFLAGLYAWLAVLLAGLTLLALAQWRLLRRVFPRLGWRWAALTVGGGVAGGGGVLYAAWAQDYERSLGNDMALYAIIFAIIGAAQWLELRRAAPQAGWWIVASILGDVTLWLTYAAVATVGPVSAAVVRARDVRPAVVLALAVQGGSSFLAYAAVMALAIWYIRSPAARQAGVLQRRFLRPLRSR
jgi:hypothetical protein